MRCASSPRSCAAWVWRGGGGRGRAAEQNVSPATMSRRVGDALRQLAEVLRGMGVAGADELTLAEHFGDPANLPRAGIESIDTLRFAPDWRALAALTPTAPASVRPFRVGVFISYAHVMTMGSNDKHGSIYGQARSTLLMTDPDLRLVGIIEPGTGDKGVVEAALREYSIVGGLIEATDVAALRTLDVILLGVLYRTTPAMMRAIRDAVSSGV